MKPSILASKVFAGTERYIFNVEREEQHVTVFAAGLSAAEKVTLELLIVDTAPSAAEVTDADWMIVKVGGNPVQLDVNNSVIYITSPGAYRLQPSATVENVTLGLYGHLG